MHMAGWRALVGTIILKGQRGQKKIAGKNHLNIFEILELFFKKEQASTQVEIRQLMAGGTRRRQAPCQTNEDKSKPL